MNERTRSTERPIVCIDLNGVLDAYTGWRGADHFDPPRPGARAFLETLASHGYRAVVFTTRSPDDVWRWLREHRLDALVDDVTDRKPAAHVFVDDRAVCFRGDFEATLHDVERFAAHWEGHETHEPTRFFLARHGRFDGVGERHAGRAGGVHLNQAGRQDADRLAAALRDVRIDAVVSSPLERARETAEPLASVHGLTIELEPALLEVDTGEWTGLSFADLDRDPQWRRFNAWRSTTRIPGGESMIAVQHRAVAAMLDLRCRYPSGIVVLVSHGDVIRSVLLYALGMPIDFHHRLEISPGHISIVEIAEDSIRVLQVNGDTATPQP